METYDFNIRHHEHINKVWSTILGLSALNTEKKLGSTYFVQLRCFETSAGFQAQLEQEDFKAVEAMVKSYNNS